MSNLASRVTVLTNLVKSRSISAASAVGKRAYATEASPEDYGYCMYFL